MEQTRPGAETKHRVNPLAIQPVWKREEKNKHACTWQYIEAGKITELISIYRAIS